MYIYTQPGTPQQRLFIRKNHIPAGSIFEMHRHDYIELEFIISGQAEHIYNSDAFSLDAGHAYIVTQQDRHAFRALSEVWLYNVGFYREALDPELVRALTGGTQRNLCCCFDSQQVQQLGQLFEELLQEHSGEEELKELCAKVLLSRIVIAILRSAKIYASRPASLPQRALEQIHSRFHNELSLSMLAEELGVTPNYLGRIFRMDTGVCFNTYLNRIRLRYACNMLIYSGESVRRIAAMSGYSSLEYFFSLFKKHFGKTPVCYRKDNRPRLAQSGISTSSVLCFPDT